MADSKPIEHFFRLRQPCPDCPFRRVGAISLSPGRIESIQDDLLSSDRTSFHCHKTVHCARGGEWTDEGEYEPSGFEAMCAGAAAWLLKRQRPTVAMRLAVAFGAIEPERWQDLRETVID